MPLLYDYTLCISIIIVYMLYICVALRVCTRGIGCMGDEVVAYYGRCM